MWRVAARPKRTTSTGSGKAPSVSTRLEASAITIMRSDAVATIFSRSSAPPPPLIRRSSPSISSAPSTVRSSYGSRRAWSADAERLGLRASPPRSARTRRRARRDLLAEQIDELRGRRAGAEAEPHAVLDILERALGGCDFKVSVLMALLAACVRCRCRTRKARRTQE